ncbi:MAG TPA: hypothetical protein VIM61_12125 [Chthoniobacterales bacterium]|jgi:hypothetical protein
MKSPRLVSLLAAMLCLGADVSAAPSLVNLAGSYTGKATSTGGGQTFTAPATLTFTGNPGSPSGTFLFNGILAQAGSAEPWAVTHTLKFNSKGNAHGRVTLGTWRGHGGGKIIASGRTMRVKLKYRINDNGRTLINLNGKVSFHGSRAKFTASVTSSDPAFAGKLKVTGKR